MDTDRLQPLVDDLCGHSGEIVFDVTEVAEGGYDASAVGHHIFTQGDDWDDLTTMVEDAVRCHFDDETFRVIRLRLNILSPT